MSVKAKVDVTVKENQVFSMVKIKVKWEPEILDPVRADMKKYSETLDLKFVDHGHVVMLSGIVDSTMVGLAIAQDIRETIFELNFNR